MASHAPLSSRLDWVQIISNVTQRGVDLSAFYDSSSSILRELWYGGLCTGDWYLTRPCKVTNMIRGQYDVSLCGLRQSVVESRIFFFLLFVESSINFLPFASIPILTHFDSRV